MLFDSTERLAHSRGLRALSEPGSSRSVFDPDLAIHAAMGAQAPERPGEDDATLRNRTHKALQAVVDRGWELWLFDPFIGAVGPDANDNAARILAEAAKVSFAARMLDTIAAFPMATGVIIDGPAWGFEIADLDVKGLEQRRRMFELPSSQAACEPLGYDLAALTAAQNQLEQRLHELTPDQVRLHAPGMPAAPRNSWVCPVSRNGPGSVSTR